MRERRERASASEGPPGPNFCTFRPNSSKTALCNCSLSFEIALQMREKGWLQPPLTVGANPSSPAPRRELLFQTH